MSTKLFSVAISHGANGDNTILPAVPGRAYKVVGYVLVGGGAVNAKFTDGAGGTAKTGAMPLTSGSVISAPLGPDSQVGGPQGWFETSVNTALVLNLSTNVSVFGHLTYCFTE